MLLTLLRPLDVVLSTTKELLPSNRFPDEVVGETVGGVRIDALNPDIIKSIIDPYTIPIDMLPWLAWQLCVEIWNDDWSDERKRWVVATSVARHRLKGTLGGLKAYLNLVDAKVVNAITPPGKTFLCTNYSASDQAAYLAQFAQVRFYPFFARAQKKYAAFTNQGFGRAKAFLGAGVDGAHVTATCFPQVVGAQERYTQHVKYWDKGIETDLTATRIPAIDPTNGTLVDYYECVLRDPKGSKLFPGDEPKSKQYLSVPDAVTRIFKVPSDTVWNPTISVEFPTTISPGTGLIESKTQIAYQKHSEQKGSFFLGRCLSKPKLPPSIAWQNIYQYWHVFDPSRVPVARKRRTHLGWTRLGMPAYTAELQVSIPGKVGPGEAWRFVHGYLRSPSKTQQQIDDARLATIVGMSIRDKITIKTKTMRPARPTDLLKVGQARVGQWIPAEP